MTYRGVVNNGVVVIEGEKPAEGTVVDPITDLGDHAAALLDLAAQQRLRIDLPRFELLHAVLVDRDDCEVPHAE